MSEQSVGDVVDVLDAWERRHLAFSPEYCARQRHRLSKCRRCLDACPVGAITWDEGLQIDFERCTRCGICATVCPTGAIEAGAPSNLELLDEIQRMVESRGSVVFACTRAVEAGAVASNAISLKCLGRLDESLLVGAVAFGAGSVRLVDSACEGCPLATGRAVASAIVDRSNALLRCLGLAPCVVLGPVSPSDRPLGSAEPGASGSGVSRRGLFKALAREMTRMVDIAIEVRQPGRNGSGSLKVTHGHSLPVNLPAKRQLLLAMLEKMDRPAETALVQTGHGLWADIYLSEDCTSCGMCAFFCATGALHRVEEDGQVELALCVARCVDCGLCQDTCYRQALVRTGEIDLNEVLADATRLLRTSEAEAEPWQGYGHRAAPGLLNALGL